MPFVFKVNFEDGFLPAKIFCGLLTQRFGYRFKISYCLIGAEAYYFYNSILLSIQSRGSEAQVQMFVYFHILI